MDRRKWTWRKWTGRKRGKTSQSASIANRWKPRNILDVRDNVQSYVGKIGNRLTKYKEQFYNYLNETGFIR